MSVELREGITHMHLSEVTALLQTSNWCPGIRLWEVEQAAENSALVVGAFINDRQVGYLRVISDKTRFAYLSDVIVDEACRRQGIATSMMRYALNHESLEDIYQWLLRTTYARGFYETLGFAPLDDPACFMGMMRPRPTR